jgi:hypothetical protein
MSNPGHAPRGIEIKGGATEFEAAVIAVVLDRITREESEARQGRGRKRELSAWARALHTVDLDPSVPRDAVRPD